MFKSFATNNCSSRVAHGSHFSGLIKFPDFSSIFFFFNNFSSIFLMFCFSTENLSILANNTQFIQILLKISNKIYLKFPEFSSILCDFPRWLFQSVQNSLTGKIPSHFSSPEWEPWSSGNIAPLYKIRRIKSTVLINYTYRFAMVLSLSSLVCRSALLRLHLLILTTVKRQNVHINGADCCCH